jgi:hypothetical protein
MSSYQDLHSHLLYGIYRGKSHAYHSTNHIRGGSMMQYGEFGTGLGTSTGYTKSPNTWIGGRRRKRKVHRRR